MGSMEQPNQSKTTMVTLYNCMFFPRAQWQVTPQPGSALLPASTTASTSLEDEAAAAAAGGIEYANEILITKSELEEKNQLVANLQNQGGNSIEQF